VFDSELGNVPESIKLVTSFFEQVTGIALEKLLNVIFELFLVYFL
jgi:hypothetical protein